MSSTITSIIEQVTAAEGAEVAGRIRHLLETPAAEGGVSAAELSHYLTSHGYPVGETTIKNYRRFGVNTKEN